MKTKIIINLFFLLFVQFACFANQPLEKGKLVFSTRCASCHNVARDLTGPALSGIDERRTIDWIVNFVHSPKAVINSQDAYAMALFNKFNKLVMPDHADLTDSDIKDIVEYIKSESKQVVEDKTPFSKPGKLRPAYEPLSLAANYGFFITFLFFVGVLIGVMLLAVQVKSVQRDKLNTFKNLKA